MTTPAQKTAIVDKLLTYVSQMILPHGLICDQVLPQISVKQRTGLLAGYGNGHLKIVSSRVGGQGEFRRVDAITRESDTYHLEKHGLFDTVTEDDYDNVEAPYEAEIDTTIGLSSIIKTEKEDVFSQVFNSTNVTQGVTLDKTKSFKVGTVDPSLHVENAHNTILDATGVSPNTCILPRKTYNVLRRHPVLRQWYRGGSTGPTTGGPVGIREVAQFLDVQRIFVPETPKSSDGKTVTQLWPDDVIFLVAPAAAVKRQVAFGYRLRNRRGGLRIYKFRTTNPPNGTDVLAQDDYSFMITNAKAAYAIRTPLAV